MNEEIRPGKIFTRSEWQKQDLSIYPEEFQRIINDLDGAPEALITLLEFTNQYIFGELGKAQVSVLKK